jgi:aspartyl protease family protein
MASRYHFVRSIAIFAGLALAAGVLGPRYASHIGIAPEPATLSAHPLTPVAAAASGSRSVIVSRDSRGQFEVDAIVNGRRLGFMVDTGASVVALTARDAARLGIRPAQNAFVAEVRTANGKVRAASARLDAVQVGPLEVRDIEALVLPDEALSDNLLGLAFLARLRRFEYSEGKLVLEQ